MVCIGLDCGGSTSRSLAIDGSGETLFAGQSGAANLSSTPEAMLMTHLRRALKDAPEPDAICGCFAGLLTPEDKLRAENLLLELFPKARVRAEPDYAAAYFATAPTPDVCIVAGTGSLICSYIDGQWITSGGGGYLLGDAGSAYDLGRQGLRFWLSREDEPTPALDEAISATFHSTNRREVVSNLYTHASPAMRIARLAQAVTKDAAAGRKYAIRVVETAMRELAEDTIRHIKRHLENVPVARIGLAGGVWRTSTLVLEIFDAILMKGLQDRYVLERGRRAPVFGAAELAKELLIGN